MCKSPIDWDELVTRAREWRCTKVTWLALSSRGVDVPSWVLAALEPGWVQRLVIQGCLTKSDGAWVRRATSLGVFKDAYEKITTLLLTIDGAELAFKTATTWSWRRLADLQAAARGTVG